MTINMDTMTIKLQEALANAQNKAVSCSNQQIEPEHLMLVLLQQKESLVPSLLIRFGLSLRNISEYLENLIQPFPTVANTSKVYLTQITL